MSFVLNLLRMNGKYYTRKEVPWKLVCTHCSLTNKNEKLLELKSPKPFLCKCLVVMSVSPERVKEWLYTLI